MSITAVKSPRFYAGPPLELDKFLAVDSQTWKAGEWAVLTSTGKAKAMAQAETRILGIMADSQSTATSSSNVRVYRIPSTECKFVGYVSNGGNDTTAQRTHIGEKAGAHVASNVLTINVGNDTKMPFKIVDCLYLKEGLKNASTDNPGQVIFCASGDSTLQG